MMTNKQLITALKELTRWLKWETRTIEEFHRYSHRFGFGAGSNVLENVLTDALRYRGMTLEQFRKGGKS